MYKGEKMKGTKEEIELTLENNIVKFKRKGIFYELEQITWVISEGFV